MRDHRKLKAFELADALVLLIYKVTRQFPKDELFGLTSQMRRAAVSVAANIVEGAARRTGREYLHFLEVSHASSRELGYHVSLAHRLGYIDDRTNSMIVEAHDHSARVLARLIQSFPGAE